MIVQYALNVAEFMRAKTFGICQLDRVHPILRFATLPANVYVTRLHQIRLIKSYAIPADSKNRGHGISGSGGGFCRPGSWRFA